MTGVDHENVVYKQATSISGGSFLSIKNIKEILPYLMTSSVLINKSDLPIVQLPTQKSVDFRASCFCHGKIVNIGYVCSVCLSGDPSIYSNYFIN